MTPKYTKAQQAVLTKPGTIRVPQVQVARRLEKMGLLTLDKPGSKWRVKLTDAGRTLVRGWKSPAPRADTQTAAPDQTLILKVEALTKEREQLLVQLGDALEMNHVNEAYIARLLEEQGRANLAYDEVSARVKVVEDAGKRACGLLWLEVLQDTYSNG